MQTNFDAAVRRAACEAGTARWNLGTNSAYALGQRKNMNKLD
jgi:hypothetical protein